MMVSQSWPLLADGCTHYGSAGMGKCFSRQQHGPVRFNKFIPYLYKKKTITVTPLVNVETNF